MLTSVLRSKRGSGADLSDYEQHPRPAPRHDHIAVRIARKSCEWNSDTGSESILEEILRVRSSTLNLFETRIEKCHEGQNTRKLTLRRPSKLWPLCGINGLLKFDGKTIAQLRAKRVGKNVVHRGYITFDTSNREDSRQTRTKGFSSLRRLSEHLSRVNLTVSLPVTYSRVRNDIGDDAIA